MYAHKLGVRAEYRQKQGRRVLAAPTLAQKYGQLKTLTVNIGYYAPQGQTPERQVTYDVNLDHAKSVFRLDCSNDECIRGDHDLTEELAQAIAKHRKTVAGELCCQGWLRKDAIRKAKCHHVLRYKLKLAYDGRR
jgi:hypothetical protein